MIRSLLIQRAEKVMKGMFKELPWLGKPLEDSILIFINAQQAALNDELRSGDVLDLITPAAGG